MTEAEWPVFAAEAEATFRGDLEADREAALREHFGAVPYEYAQRCLRELVLRGQVFVPTPGELVTSLRRVVGGNGWDFRRILAGRTDAEQRVLDHVATCRALNVAPDPEVLEQFDQPQLGAGS